MTPQDQLSLKEMVTCRRGHLHEKQPPRKGCPICLKAARKNWVKNHPNEFKAINKRYLESNKEVVKKRQKKYRENHSEQRRASFASWFSRNREKNRERCLKRARANRSQNVWRSMIDRCTNSKNKQYKDYGGRGITVCGRWSGEDGFLNFVEDMAERPSPRHEIDRRDNSLGYSKENCRWVTREIQSRNRRTNHWIEYNGETMCATDWAIRYGLTPQVLTSRLCLGWPIELALTKPVKRSSK